MTLSGADRAPDILLLTPTRRVPVREGGLDFRLFQGFRREGVAFYCTEPP